MAKRSKAVPVDKSSLFSNTFWASGKQKRGLILDESLETVIYRPPSSSFDVTPPPHQALRTS